MTMSTWIICDAIAGPSPQDSMFSFILGLMPWIFLYLHYTATIWWTDRAYKTIQLLPPLQFPPPTVRKRPSCISGYFSDHPARRKRRRNSSFRLKGFDSWLIGGGLINLHTSTHAHLKCLVPISWKLFKLAASFEAWMRYGAEEPKLFHAHPSYHSPQPCAYSTHNHCDSMRFDSDSASIGFDTHASSTMSGIKQFFEDLVLRSDLGSCGGISGGLKIAGVGTFILKLQDDDGKEHVIKIPNSFYIPGLKPSLVCPQHWAQEADDHSPLPDGTIMETFSDRVVLRWNQRKYQRTIPLRTSTNTPTIHTGPGHTIYSAFCTIAMRAQRIRDCLSESVLQVPDSPERRRKQMEEYDELGEENLLMKEEMKHRDYQSSSDDETVRSSNRSDNNSAPINFPANQPCPLHPGTHHFWGECSQYQSAQRHHRGPLTVDFAPSVEPPTHHWIAEDPKAELLWWHHRLGHTSFALLKLLAELGEIPKPLAKVTPPFCAGCQFGAKTKKPWRTKHDIKPIRTATKPGECISVDQLLSSQDGFIAQLKGRLTRQRYKAATIFVDHFSRLCFVHFHQSLSSAETIEAKEAFEKFAARHSVRIQQYHCDNGRFADSAFISHCEANKQLISYCGVNAHFQNGIAERAIRDIQDNARKSLLHAVNRWPNVISFALWPYAMRYAVYLHNVLPSQKDGRSRLEVFGSLIVGHCLRDCHTFGCPVYALQNALQVGNPIPK